MRILFDANPLNHQRISGIGYFCNGLLQALTDNYGSELELVGYYYSFLKNEPIQQALPKNVSTHAQLLIPGRVVNMARRFGIQLPVEIIAGQRADVNFFMNYLSLPSMFGVPSVCVVHDMAFVDTPEYVQPLNRHDLEHYLPGTIRRSKRVITISQTTKSRLCELYGTDPDKITVCGIPPVTPSKPRAKGSLLQFGITKPYLLFVGTVEPRKNLLNLVKAYDLLSVELKRHYQLVIAGGKGWEKDEFYEAVSKANSQSQNIVLTDYIDDSTKATLFANASLYVQPSLYEGFGMPILEAFGYNLPVAASDIPIFHEVAGNGAAYFDHRDPHSISQTITDLLSAPSKRSALITAASKQLEKYSWQQTASVVYETLKQSTK